MKGNRFYYLIVFFAALAFLLSAGALAAKADGKIIHDAEHYILEAQHSQKWAAEDSMVQKFAIIILRRLDR